MKKIKILHRLDVSAVLAFLTCLAIVSIGIYSAQKTQAKPINHSGIETTSLMVPPPTQLQDLVNHADLIIIGTITTITQEGYFQGYDENGNFKPAAHFAYSEEAPVNPNIPFVDYAINVEQVILNDGTIKINQPVIVRATGINVNNEKQNKPQNELASLGERRLFFLSQNPDGETYGPYYGAFGRLIIDGDIVTFSDINQTPVVFTNEKTDSTFAPQQFIEVVKHIVEKPQK